MSATHTRPSVQLLEGSEDSDGQSHRYLTISGLPPQSLRDVEIQAAVRDTLHRLEAETAAQSSQSHNITGVSHLFVSYLSSPFVCLPKAEADFHSLYRATTLDLAARSASDPKSQ